MKVQTPNYHSTTFFYSITAIINPRKAIMPLLRHQTIDTRAKSHTPTAQTTLPQHTPAHNQLAGWSYTTEYKTAAPRSSQELRAPSHWYVLPIANTYTFLTKPRCDKKNKATPHHSPNLNIANPIQRQLSYRKAIVREQMGYSEVACCAPVIICTWHPDEQRVYVQ